jgi:hypothetical protein
VADNAPVADAPAADASAADAPAATSAMGFSFFSIAGVFLRGFFDAKWRR